MITLIVVGIILLYMEKMLERSEEAAECCRCFGYALFFSGVFLLLLKVANSIIGTTFNIFFV